MSLHAMPLIVLNMGAEMLYILEQRLHAQNIAKDKRTKVLVDVVRTMYSERFVTELFKPQHVYTNEQTRQIFDKLAHSSVMRLNKSSMEKLYDLMSMGFKYQVLACAHPSHYVQVTCNHLEELERIVNHPVVSTLIGSALQQTIKLYSSFTAGQLCDLKESLCRFFQDRRVKVSLFLQDGIQNNDGSFRIDCTGAVGSGVEIPGIVRYFNAAGETTSTQMLKMEGQEGVLAESKSDPLDPQNRPCKLGGNLYSVNRDAERAAQEASSKQAAEAEEAAAGEVTEEPPAPVAAPSGKGGTKGLNMLASMMGQSADDAAGDSPAVKIDFSLGSSWMFGTQQVATRRAQVVTFDAKASSKTDMMSKLGLDDDDADVGGKAADDSDDLLSLMDGI